MSSHVILRGSYRECLRDSTPAGQPPLDQGVQITVVLRRRAVAPAEEAISDPLSRPDLVEAHGADPADIAVVKTFAASHGLTVDEVNLAARFLKISGPLSDIARAFGADLELRQVGSRTLRTRQGSLRVPSTLHERVV